MLTPAVLAADPRLLAELERLKGRHDDPNDPYELPEGLLARPTDEQTQEFPTMFEEGELAGS